MKKILCLILAVMLLLCGCNRADSQTAVPSEPSASLPPADAPTLPQEETVTPPTEGVSEGTTGEIVYAQQPMAAVSLPLCTEYLTDDDVVIYSYTYQNIFLTVQDQPVADEIIVDFLNRLDNSRAISQDLADQASSAYSGDEYWDPYFFETVYSPMRVDHSILSLFGRNVIHTGSHHSQQECMAANYSMVTGEVLTLGSILQDANAIEALCDLVKVNMQEQHEASSLFADYQQIIDQRFAREASYDEDWYFSVGGLCFYFSPYEIAPYTSGIITVEVPYEELTGIIADAFFPAEIDQSAGVVRATKLADTELDSFTQIAEIALSDIGEQIFLCCDGLVRNVRIDSGVWNDDGTVFTETATVFVTHTLSPGDGIVLTAQIPDVLPTLKLSYQSNAETVTYYIAQSGADGSILLIDGVL